MNAFVTVNEGDAPVDVAVTLKAQLTPACGTACMRMESGALTACREAAGTKTVAHFAVQRYRSD